MENPLHSKEEIERIKTLMFKDADTLGSKSRYGYFSIPYPATIGDRYYASKSKIPVRDELGKVKLHPRNMRIQMPKSGHAPDVYFTNPFKEDPNNLKRHKFMAKNDYKTMLNKVKERKESKEKGFKMCFKPSGPAEKKDYFTVNPYHNKQPIYKEKPKNYSIDKETRKVIIENRNIKTAFPKKGGPGYPDICFSYPKSEKPKKTVRAKTALIKTRDNKFTQPFKPANIQLNSTFFSDRKQFAPPESKIKEYTESYKRAKTAGNRKFQKSARDYYVKHDRSFKPSSNMKLGEKGYFSARYGNPFVPYIPKKRAETSKEKKFSVAFK